MLSSLLPQTLTEGVMREGGLGLAGQLLGSLDPSAATAGVPTSAGVSGGVSAPASSASASASVAAAASNGAAAHSGGASA